jgi:uncharacterized membrane protein
MTCKFEIGHQVATWSGAIAGGVLGTGVGALVGPVGAIVGGLIGYNRRTRQRRMTHDSLGENMLAMKSMMRC